MDAAAITEAVEEILLLSDGAPAGEDAEQMRSALAFERHPDFAEKYPKLLLVCCAATTPDTAASVRNFLSLMLTQMRSMDTGAATLEGASLVVGQALGERFAPHLLAKKPE
jgi:hypothetical protein